MSLLLEALKKAEKAKEDAQRRAGGADAGGEPAASVFDAKATVAADGKHVMRRDELPDISAPLEILSDDLRPAARAKSAAPLELALAESPPTPTPPAAAPERRAMGRATARAASGAEAADPAGAERAAAHKVFEAKFKEPNPRLPFYIAMSLLGALAAGTVVYFWIQLRPPPPLVNTNPVRSASEKPVDPVVDKPATTAAAPASTGASVIPGLPGSTPPQLAAAPVPAVSPAPPATAAAAPAPTAAAPVLAPAASAPRPPARSRSAARSAPAPKDQGGALRVTRGGPQIHPQVNAGYGAYQAGDLAKARTEYEQVLREEPGNRDALLGLAAVEMRAQRYDLSDAYYQRVLRADPRDPHAQAGLLALRSQQLDPVLVESRVKSLLAADREANVLYFTLGNQYAQQGRWAEAQQAYFKAFATDPDNADYAFNLAVSLDQLHQPALALEYYRRALALAEKRSASFAPEVARTRVQQLSR